MFVQSPVVYGYLNFSSVIMICLCDIQLFKKPANYEHAVLNKQRIYINKF